MSNMNKTGIVIVSYNASEAVRVTLSSIRQAHNNASFKLILVDNASEPSEQEKIRAAMSKHIAEEGNSWRYIEQEKNLGFSGGNNVGISEFFQDEEISHICLLNSDVIVTDHWLDRLLAGKFDIASAVTNKADSEQCVPVDYQVELSECLDESTEMVKEQIYRRISDFSDRWHEAWKGNSVETDVTFFCVLLSINACRKIGLLDETFFPGGFEDDDYCLRARQAGYQIYLARDAFIHHWGSASFGQLQYEYFSGRAQKNKAYLEEKHGIVWQRRPEKPIVSFSMDIAFALQHKDKMRLQGAFLELYLEKITNQIAYFESEFRNLSASLASCGRDDVSDQLNQMVKSAKGFGDLNALWLKVVHQLKDSLLAGSEGQLMDDSVLSDLKCIELGIHDRVECNFAIHAFVTSPVEQQGDEGVKAMSHLPSPVASVPEPSFCSKTRFEKLLWLLRKGWEFIYGFNGIVFFGGYFYSERQSDGYFQRIQAVDRMFTDRWRVYVESDELRGRDIWFDRPEPNVLVLRITGSRKKRMLVRLLALLAVLRGRKIYFHSVLRMYDNRFGRLLHLPFIRKAVDIHGVVPEEFRMHNDFFSALLYEKEEKLAVEKSGIVIVVTDAMKHYLQQKFRQALRAQVVSFPIFPSFKSALQARPFVDGKPIVVYAGGLHKWQQVPKMMDAIIKTSDKCCHRFYCPDPQQIKDILPNTLLDSVVVEEKTHAELMILYPECHYGFILREDIIVNRAACPTKLIEYLAMGIVPIVDSEDIGDFKSLGMQFICLNDFLNGALPDEEHRVEMAKSNFAVYEALKQIRKTGAAEIYEFFSQDKKSPQISQAFVRTLACWLPADTVLGRVARRIKNVLRPRAVASPLQIDVSLSMSQTPPLGDADAAVNNLVPCDILVQVDNFEAGGLENVVIDLNNTLSEAGYNVVLLVLGNQGVAVGRAQALNQRVICQSYSRDTYTELIKRLNPKLVLTHYSIQGVDMCYQESIPFVQVIHNIYMWFNEQQRREFSEAAKLTTAFVAVSDYVKKYSVSCLGVIPEKCIVIHNGIDFGPFEALKRQSVRASLRANYGISDKEFVFLDVGAINHQKNHLGMVKAFEIVAQTCQNAKLLILGPSYEKGLEQEIYDYIEKVGLKNKVIYCGAAPAVHEYLAMADAFAASSFFEGCQLSLLEAIVGNLPIVTAEVGCASGFADRKGITLVEPVYDMENFQSAIWEMKSSPLFEQQLAEAMIKTWKKPECPDFSPSELAKLDRSVSYGKYVQLVKKVIAHQSVSEDLLV